MDTSASNKKRLGRPPKARNRQLATREVLIRTGLEALTEKGFASTGLDALLRPAGVPKGSFYHYFPSKEAYGAELIDAYARFFAYKLDKHLKTETLPPLERIQAFVDEATEGMAKHDFRRGCLIGNLGQEMSVLPASYRDKLQQVLQDWQTRLEACLQLAQQQGQLSPEADARQLAVFFWTGWEGAVLRAKLERSPQPLQIFAGFFLQFCRRSV